MAITLKSISKERATRSPRVVLLGVEKVGKSTWASGAPDPIAIPIKNEEGLDQLASLPAFPVCNAYQDVLDCLSVLCNEEHAYRTVIIDSSSALEPLLQDHAIKKAGVDSVAKLGGGYGNQEAELLKYWREIMEACDFLRNEKQMGCILIGHTKVKRFNDPLCDPYDTYSWDLRDSAAQAWYRWADVIGFATFKAYTSSKEVNGQKKTVHATGKGERILFLEKRPGHPGGNRYGLPYELPLEYPAFATALETARNGARA